MKSLGRMLFVLLMGLTVAAHALDQGVKVDVLMSKANAAIKMGRAAEALPYLAELESMGPSLKKPLSEDFYVLYIDVLDKSGDKEEAMNRAEAYLEKYGKKGKLYDQVVETMGRIQIEANGEEKAAAAREVQKEREAEEKTAAEAQKDREAHAQSIKELRVCKNEAIALKKSSDGLEGDQKSLERSSSLLDMQRATLETQISMVRSSQYPMPFIEAQIQTDTQTYNNHVRELNAAKREYRTDLQQYNNRLDHYKSRCQSIEAKHSEITEVCGNSQDWFCSGFE